MSEVRLNESRKRDISVALGHAIAARREAAGLTQEQVSEMLGIGNQAISRMERGAVLPSVHRLYEFSAAFGCRVEDLLRSSSEHPHDRAQQLARHFEGLGADDQRVLIEALKLISDQLRKKNVDRPSRRKS